MLCSKTEIDEFAVKFLAYKKYLLDVYKARVQKWTEEKEILDAVFEKTKELLFKMKKISR